ncbi:MAG: DUF3352 domain-containing protein [Elainellaceae cyanobacterium]
MKFQAFLRILLAGVLALLLLALGGAVWLRTQMTPAAALETSSKYGAAADGADLDGTDLEGTDLDGTDLGGTNAIASSPSKTLAFVPSRTLALGALRIDATDWEAAQISAVSPQERRSLRRQLGQLKQKLRQFGIRYNRDIRPWIGSEVTAALVSLDEDRDLGNGSQPGYLMAIATDAPQASQSFLERFWQGRSPQTSRQAGVEIVHAGAGLSTAHVGRQLVLVASHLSVLQDAISSAQVPPLNIQSRQRYAAAIAQLPPERWGFILADLSQLRPWLSEDWLSLVRQRVTKEDWTAEHDALIAAITPASRDLAVRLWLTSFTDLENNALENGPSKEAKGSEDLPTAQTSLALAAWLPSTSAAAILDRNLAARWSTVLAEDESSPLAVTALEAIAPPDLEALGIDAQEIRDWVAPWVKQGYGIAKLPRPQDDNLDWLFATPASSDVEAGFKDLDNRAQAQGLTVGIIPYKGHPLTVWTNLAVGLPSNNADGDIPSLIATVKGAHTVVDDTALMATSVGAIAQALQTTDADLVSRAAETLGPSANGYVHLAWPEVRALAASAASDERDLFEALDSIVESVTLTHYGEGEVHPSDQIGIFINLKG